MTKLGKAVSQVQNNDCSKRAPGGLAGRDALRKLGTRCSPGARPSEASGPFLPRWGRLPDWGWEERTGPTHPAATADPSRPRRARLRPSATSPGEAWEATRTAPRPVVSRIPN